MSEDIEKPDTLKEFLKKINTPEGIQESFLSAKESIEDACGIKLSTIELVALKKITEEVIKQAYEEENDRDEKFDSLNMIDPKKEIEARFFQNFYGLNTHQIETLYKEGTEAFQNYFIAQQARLHNEL